MSDYPWDQPVSGSNWFKPADHEGNLILITAVHEIVPAYDDLKKDDVDRAEFDYVDLDDEVEVDANGLPVKQVGVYNGHVGIVRKLKTSLRNGRGILARIGSVPTDKGNAAWVLAPYDEDGDDAARAKAWLDAQTNGKFVQPDDERPAPKAKAAPVKAAPVKTAPVKTAPVKTAAKPAAKAAPVKTAAKPATTDAFTVNGVEVDPEQFVKLAALGIVTPTADQVSALEALGHQIPA